MGFTARIVTVPCHAAHTDGTDLNPTPQQILSADKMVADSLYTDASEKYQSYIDQYPTDEWTLTALRRIVQTAKLAKLDSDLKDILNDNELINSLDDIYTNNSIHPVGLQALDYSVAVSVTLGNPTDALVRNTELLTKYSEAEYNDEDVAFALLEQAVLQELLEEEGLSRVSVESGYQKLIDTYPQSLAVKEAQLLLNKPTVEPTENVNIPNEFVLHPAYPNPFNPIIQLRYDLPEQSYVQIAIYDLLGRQVTSLVNQTQEAGNKSIQWDGTYQYGQPVSAGVYLYQIKGGDFVQTRKMVLLK